MKHARPAAVAARWFRATSKRLYYHGTSAKHLDSIRSRGLLGTPPQRVWEGNLAAIPGYVYLTTSPWVAVGYAIDATTRTGDDMLVLVVELDRDDPRVMADEDIIPKVWGRAIEQDLHVRPQGSRGDRGVLVELWRLANGKPPPGTFKGSREHLVALMKATEDYPDKLGQIIDAYIKPGEPSDRYGLLDDVDDRPRLIQTITEGLKKSMVRGLSHLALSGFVKPERALEWATSNALTQLEGGAEQSEGVRSRTWMRYKDQWQKDWPEWFGPEAGLVRGDKPTVAVEAKSVRPDEIWLIPRGTNTRGLRSYNDLPNYGTRVD